MARRTFAEYKADVLHALGNPAEADMTITPEQIVNDALEHLAALHPWSWQSTGEQSLDIVGEQAYVELPADFGSLVAIEHDGGWARQMIPTTWQEMLRFRTDAIQNWSRSYWYLIAIGQVDSTAPEDGLDVPRIELYPTPADDADDAIKIVYRRFLRRLDDDDDVPQWPSYMDRPLSLLARGFATTDYDDSPGGAYTEEFRTLITDLIARDGLTRKSLGVPRGGLYPKTVPISPFYPSSIPDPTVRHS